MKMMNGRKLNITEGLELHTGVFNIVKQKILWNVFMTCSIWVGKECLKVFDKIFFLSSFILAQSNLPISFATLLKLSYVLK